MRKIITICILVLTSVTASSQNFELPDVNPEFLNGGTEGFFNFISENMIYPEESRVNCKHGQLVLMFMIS